MKKLAIVALALVLAMTFVGCGVPAELLGTWERDWGGQGDSWEFKANKEVVYTYYVGDVVSSTITYDYVADGDVVTISRNNVEIYKWNYEVDGDKLKFYQGGVLLFTYTKK